MQAGVPARLRAEDDPDGTVRVRGLRSVDVRSAEEIFEILERTLQNRRTAETLCNRHSSRSHAIFRISIRSTIVTPTGGQLLREGELNLIDLCGSECIKKSGSEGIRAREAGMIGQSLLTLGRVIKALAEKGSHVPYRDSKLTRVVTNSLGGDSLTAVILNVSPSHKMLEETISTLKYASLAQTIQNAPKQKVVDVTDCQDGPLIRARVASKEGGDGGIGQDLLGSVPVCPWEGQVPIRSRNKRTTAWGEEPGSDTRSPVPIVSAFPLASDMAATQPKGSTKYAKAKQAAEKHANSVREPIISAAVRLYDEPALQFVRENLLEDEVLSRGAVAALHEIFGRYDVASNGSLNREELARFRDAWAGRTPALPPRLSVRQSMSSAAAASASVRHDKGLAKLLTLDSFLSFCEAMAQREPYGPVFICRLLTSSGYRFSFSLEHTAPSLNRPRTAVRNVSSGKAVGRASSASTRRRSARPTSAGGKDAWDLEQIQPGLRFATWDYDVERELSSWISAQV